MTTSMDSKSKYFKEFRASRDFKVNANLYDLFKLWDDMKMSYQWGNSKSKRAKTVNNICRRIVGYKVPAIASNNIKFNYSPKNTIETEETQELYEVSRVLSYYSNTMYKQLDMKTKNEKMADQAATVGASYIHFFWDNNVLGANGNEFVGEVDSEVINSMNYYPRNPYEEDVQKQTSFIIKKREDVESVKARAKAAGVPDDKVALIVPTTVDTGKSYSAASINQSQSTQTDLYVRYCKKQEEMEVDGIYAYANPMRTVVYWSEFTEQVDIIDERVLEGHELYPMDGMVWYSRTDFAFGQGEIEPIIPNQRALNLVQSMQVEVIKKVGMPPVGVDNTKIKGEVSFDSGKIYRTNGDPRGALHVFDVGAVNPQTFDLFNVLLNVTKDLSAATEDALGERGGADLNATAIALQQKAAKTPLKPIQSNYQRAQKRFGLILIEFFLNQYDNRQLNYEDGDGAESTFDFIAEKYADLKLDLNVAVTSSADYSDELDVSTLDRLKSDGDINKQQYVELLPEEYASFKDELLKMWEQEDTDDITIVIDQLNELYQQGRIQDFFNQQPEQQMEFIQQIRDSIE